MRTRLNRNLDEQAVRSGGILHKYVGILAPRAAGQIERADGEPATGDDYAIGGVISAYGVEDSYGDVFLPGAFDPLPDWLPMLWMHRRGELVGRWGEVYQEGNNVRAGGAVWSESGIRLRAIREEIMRGLSVGAYIDEFTVKRRPDGWMGWDIIKARLVETSVVDVPANPAAEIDVTEANDGEDPGLAFLLFHGITGTDGRRPVR